MNRTYKRHAVGKKGETAEERRIRELEKENRQLKADATILGVEVETLRDENAQLIGQSSSSDDAKTADEARKAQLSAMDVDQLKEYAKTHNIALGNSTAQPGILEKILKADGLTDK